MREQCPSNFVLDAFRLGFDGSPADHVKACPRCSDWLVAQARLAGTLQPLAFTTAQRRPRAGIVKYLLGLGLPVAVGATVLLLVARPNPPTEIAKGTAVPVEIARMRAGEVRWISPEDGLLPSDSVRFRVNRHDLADGYVLVGSVDGSGQLSRFYPAEANGCSVSLPPPAQLLPDSIVFDGAVGPERIVVVVSHRPLCWAMVAEPARQLALGGPAVGELAAPDVHVTRLILPKQEKAQP